ncbi:restriction endonuclease [Streptomyces sp. B1I3]|uniref:restriction endonuclease n=1 Tax=Streptomyces sp. B1I3 TaxID=3042264 RepID=UPI002785BF0F|nr:restriction endonuclease [Streptomyces sp. B1I3]MDQ0798090.1 restriction system protein [Streptomyces sp. B1I3]
MTARRPAPRRRRSPARSRKRKQAYTGAEILAGIFVIGWLLSLLMHWLAAHPWVPLLFLLITGAGAFLWFRTHVQQQLQRQTQMQTLRYRMDLLDRLHHRQFEHAIRDLMLRDGCQNAVQVGGAGDNGADVKATDPFGRRWVIQCKHRRAGLAGAAVGTPDLHVLNGTGRPVHKGDVIVLVTNGRFTKPATDFAQSQRLHLVDRHTLATWAGGQRPLWELLNAIPPPRRPTPLS